MLLICLGAQGKQSYMKDNLLIDYFITAALSFAAVFRVELASYVF